MTRPLRNLISAVTLAALTGLLVLAATQWTDVFFRFYPAFSRWILGVLAGITSVTSFPLWEPGLINALCITVARPISSCSASHCANRSINKHAANAELLFISLVFRNIFNLINCIFCHR